MIVTQDDIADACRKFHAATCVVLAERWLQDHPHDLWAMHKHAEMLYKMTRYDEAIRVYTQAIERFPDEKWGIYNQLGHLFRYRGEFPEAEKWYRLATELNLDDATSLIFLGSIQARQGRLEDAEISHRQATRCSDGCIDEAYLNLGLVLRAQNRFAEAAEAFRKAIEIYPKYYDAVEALEDVTQVITLLAENSDQCPSGWSGWSGRPGRT
jgi:Tfp pilus assembly protein PilF